MLRFKLPDSREIYIGFEHIDECSLDADFHRRYKLTMDAYTPGDGVTYPKLERLSAYYFEQIDRKHALVEAHTNHRTRNVRGITRCELLASRQPSTPEDVLANELSICWHNEKNFSKKLGRKYSFAKALHAAFPGYENKLNRRELWRQFFAATNWQ